MLRVQRSRKRVGTFRGDFHKEKQFIKVRFGVESCGNAHKIEISNNYRHFFTFVERKSRKNWSHASAAFCQHQAMPKGSLFPSADDEDGDRVGGFPRDRSELIFSSGVTSLRVYSERLRPMTN
jgi:hypothetical protein